MHIKEKGGCNPTRIQFNAHVQIFLGKCTRGGPYCAIYFIIKRKRKRVTGKEDKTCTGETKPVLCKYVGTRQVLDKGVET